MTFNLTETLITAICGALENQEDTFLVYAEEPSLVSGTENQPDEDKFYSLPEWNSADGFKLMEDFTDIVHQPLVKEELLDVLHSGRGVFRNYKIVIKKYPEVEKKWHVYKNKVMQNYVKTWYNGLCEIWGLEKLDIESESDLDLVHDDFTFKKMDLSRDKETILKLTTITTDDDITESVQNAVNILWKKHFESFDTANHTGFICHSLDEDFAGCISTAQVSENSDVMILTNLYVPEHFRGLGIGSELLQMTMSELKNSGKKWLMLPNIILPEAIEPLLLKSGFKKMMSGFAADLQQK